MLLVLYPVKHIALFTEYFRGKHSTLKAVKVKFSAIVTIFSAMLTHIDSTVNTTLCSAISLPGFLDI